MNDSDDDIYYIFKFIEVMRFNKKKKQKQKTVACVSVCLYFLLKTGRETTMRTLSLLGKSAKSVIGLDFHKHF